ncbi:hypothetical protein J6590_103891 [Homalodisca vitripennis]|nr:hypothetical protein J6590_103891 [Homalodisca vitripennis]
MAKVIHTTRNLIQTYNLQTYLHPLIHQLFPLSATNSLPAIASQLAASPETDRLAHCFATENRLISTGDYNKSNDTLCWTVTISPDLLRPCHGESAELRRLRCRPEAGFLLVPQRPPSTYRQLYDRLTRNRLF